MPTEFELIARFFRPEVHHTLLAGGDDAALLVPSPGRQLAVTTDMLVEGVHFLPGADAEALGHKVLAVNLSDLAAMGAIPRWVFLGVALPRADEVWCERFARGFLDLARAFDVDLAGGDTTRGPLNLCVTAVGEVEPGLALRRSGARPGDDIWLTGTTGEAAFGLQCCLGATAGAHPVAVSRCRQRLERPWPRVAFGREALGLATAAIDVSDGLVADLGHVCAASGVGAVIDWDRLPQSSALAGLEPVRRQELVLSGGDDYELVLTAPPGARSALLAAADRCDTPLARIGSVQEGRGVAVRDRDGRMLPLARTGFDHFA
ncbi:MAG: thiamine-phosphate kinase [Betaproteobacteria bacterium]|jgi:thiamine-monophosphate kinase